MDFELKRIFFKRLFQFNFFKFLMNYFLSNGYRGLPYGHVDFVSSYVTKQRPLYNKYQLKTNYEQRDQKCNHEADFCVNIIKN